jgi:hypothetical protein
MHWIWDPLGPAMWPSRSTPCCRLVASHDDLWALLRIMRTPGAEALGVVDGGTIGGRRHGGLRMCLLKVADLGFLLCKYGDLHKAGPT